MPRISWDNLSCSISSSPTNSSIISFWDTVDKLGAVTDRAETDGPLTGERFVVVVLTAGCGAPDRVPLPGVTLVSDTVSNTVSVVRVLVGALVFDGALVSDGALCDTVSGIRVSCGTLVCDSV